MIDELFSVIQELSDRPLWSRAVEMTRSAEILQDFATEKEIRLRILLKNKPVSPRVILWPQDEDWKCDCKDEEDPCIHVVAAAIALRNNKVRSAESSQNVARSGQIHYIFRRRHGSLSFERKLVWPGEEKLLHGTLMNHVAGVTSGRIEGKSISATKEDYFVDQILGDKKEGTLDHTTMSRLIPALAGMPNVFLDENRILASEKPLEFAAELIDEKGGFRLRALQEQKIEEMFSNGAVLIEGRLMPVPTLTLSESEIKALSQEGGLFQGPDIFKLRTEILPGLQRKMRIQIQTDKLPAVEKFEPSIHLKTELQKPQTLVVTPVLVYGDPPIAQVVGDELYQLQGSVLPLRDREREGKLSRKLQLELNLKPDQPTLFKGIAGVQFILKSQGWPLTGPGVEHFQIENRLAPEVKYENGNLSVHFKNPSGKTALGENVYRAWQEGSFYVPLEEGGWAPLPKDWMNRYADTLKAYMNSRQAEPVPKHQIFEIVQILEEQNSNLTPDLDFYRTLLKNRKALPDPSLPDDLTARLRPYQVDGVRWMQALLQNELGVLLADDMGLGKTLQALCVTKGRTLIVTPTSVLSTWLQQIENFRPRLKAQVYHGTQRKLDRDADVVVTSYGLLRSETETFLNLSWQTIIVDEAQNFKNPESQTALAVHQLKAPYRIALSGTPIENSLDDLWSLFRFLNPGLLGARSEFITSQNPEHTSRRARPFILRRLKTEVAKDLPAKTESILHCELNSDEKQLYEALKQSARKEILDQLNEGESILALLERLLRLRQACCHPALVPGQRAESSSKTELLIESLLSSLSLGHRALIFSQWTSYLDLIEPHLKSRSISYLRLDGTTRDRAAVVSKYQDPAGPPVMLISLKAGGVGLTLTRADHVYLMDPWWNPAVEDQAADRAHRIGQENPVFVYRLVAKDTVEDRVIQLQKSKKSLAESILSGTSGTQSLSRDDLLDLLVD